MKKWKKAGEPTLIKTLSGFSMPQNRMRRRQYALERTNYCKYCREKCTGESYNRCKLSSLRRKNYCVILVDIAKDYSF